MVRQEFFYFSLGCEVISDPFVAKTFLPSIKHYFFVRIGWPD
ncbi:MAG: hypothetical protein OJF52_001423 [Nitrospira sp.]|nr:MAG: hypothetical protein OJF52_001423 [Nitrospira sp.]